MQCHTHYSDISLAGSRCKKNIEERSWKPPIQCGGLIQMTKAEVDAEARVRQTAQQEILFRQHLAAVARRREKFAHPQPRRSDRHATSRHRF